MDYQDAMELLSECGLGAVVISADDTILAVNEIGGHLLHGESRLIGQRLSELAGPLCEDSEEPLYANVAFGEYLLRCPSPNVTGLPPRSRLIVFRNAANDACHDMLINMLNRISESVALFDAEGRVYLLNDAAVQMESIVTRDILGEKVADVYQMLDNTELAIPKVLREKRPLLKRRQYYTTRFGKDIDVVSNTYPITQNGQLLGGFSVMEDWHKLDELHKQILDLQGKLLRQDRTQKKNAEHMLAAKYDFRDIIYVSAAMGDVVARCRRVAKNDSPVMIYGETGTGKEMFAQSIHSASKRSSGPFLAINCAAIPENLLEALLFGTEKGAYTGAECREGLFEQADGGTLLLDEINSMNVNLQSKLLRVLQEGTFRRVGGSEEIRVDVRVLSNTNVPPYQAIREGMMRQDLYYRLGVVNIDIPPLRERKEDISLLAKSFIMRYNEKIVKNVKDIDKATLNRFCSYDWPGNVRELQHAIEHAMNILPDDFSVITPEYIPQHILYRSENLAVPVSGRAEGASLNRSIQSMERRTVCQALRKSGGNISEAARSLKISRQSLQYRIKRYQINVQNVLDGTE